MSVQLPSFGSDVPETVQRSLKMLASAVNSLEPMMKGGDSDAVADLPRLRQQLTETVSRVDDLTRRIRALGG